MEILHPVHEASIYQRARSKTRGPHKIFEKSRQRFARSVSRAGSRHSRRTNSSSDSDAFFGVGSEPVHAAGGNAHHYYYSVPPTSKRPAVPLLPALNLPAVELVDTSPTGTERPRWKMMRSPDEAHPGTPWSWTPAGTVTPGGEDAAPKFFPYQVASTAPEYFELEGDTPTTTPITSATATTRSYFTTSTNTSPVRHFGSSISPSVIRVTHPEAAAAGTITPPIIEKPTPASILKPARTVRASSHPPTRLKLFPSTPNLTSSSPKAARWSNLEYGHRRNDAGSVASTAATHAERRGVGVPPGSREGPTPSTFDCDSPESSTGPSFHASPSAITKPLPPTPPATPPKPSSYFPVRKMAPNQQNSYSGGMGVTTVNPSSTYHHIHEMVAKRISTLDYLRKTHEGRVYWFNTLLFSQPDILRLPSFQPPRLARRASHLLLLGLSIPAAVDSNAQSALDYVKALNALLMEFETYQQMHPTEGSSTGIGSGRFNPTKLPKMFFPRGSVGSKTRRASTATDIGLPLPPGFDSVVGADGSESLASSTASLSGGSTAVPSSAGGSSSTGGPLLTSQVGGGIGGGGGARAPGTTTTSTAALPAPDATMLLPGEEYTYLLTPSIPFEPDFFEVFATLSEALIDVYMRIAALVTSPEKVALQPGLAEAFAKADARIRKLLVLGIVKEFEESTRSGVKGEMAGVGRVVLGGLM